MCHKNCWRNLFAKHQGHGNKHFLSVGDWFFKKACLCVIYSEIRPNPSTVLENDGESHDATFWDNRLRPPGTKPHSLVSLAADIGRKPKLLALRPLVALMGRHDHRPCQLSFWHSTKEPQKKRPQFKDPATSKAFHCPVAIAPPARCYCIPANLQGIQSYHTYTWAARASADLRTHSNKRSTALGLTLYLNTLLFRKLCTNVSSQISLCKEQPSGVSHLRCS